MASPARLKIEDENHALLQMDEGAQGVLKVLLRLISDLRQTSSECRRIQRGSPGAGALSESTQIAKSQLNAHKSAVEALLEKYLALPGVRRLKFCYAEFDNVLNEFVNEAGNEDGYTTRVRYLEKMNFVSGTLKGHVEALLEQIECWCNRGAVSSLSGEVARRLIFSDEDCEREHLQASMQDDQVFSGGDIEGM